MLGLAIRKMWNKKWMNLCLLIGIILMVSTLVSFPLYQGYAYDRMLQDEFVSYLQKEGKWPTVDKLITYSKKDKKGTTITKMEEYVEGLDDTLGVNSVLNIRYYSLLSSSLVSEMKRPDISGKNVRLACMSDIEDHATIIYGEGLSESGKTEDGAVEVIVDESCMIEKGFILGEILTLENVSDENGKPVRICIKGVYDTSKNDDYYWQIDKLDLLNVCFMKEDLFREMFLGKRVSKYSITCEYYHLFSYEDIKYEQAQELYNTAKYITEKSKKRSLYDGNTYIPVLESYLNKQTRIRGTLAILQIPVLILVAAFLIMISSQMYEMEKNEISVIGSRGAYRRQVFLLYLFQNLLLTVTGTILGILLGKTFASMLGATRNFLEISLNDIKSIPMNVNGEIYALAGLLFCLVCLTIPVIPHSKVSVVNLKHSRNNDKKPLWQLLWLDVIALGVAGYGYYSCSKNMTDISATVLSGKSLDPLLYISSSVFILGAGLLYIRIQPYLSRFIQFIGNAFWGPAAYISFMENRRNAKKQQLIMLFLIMTISLGMYHAVVARTILDNALDNRNYLDAADVCIREKWMPIMDENGMATGQYIEPDFQKYLSADFVEKATRVYFDKNAYFTKEGNERQKVTVMGIHTREFGEITDIKASLNEKSYYTYLNELAENADNIIVSTNFKTVYGYDYGDTIIYRNEKGVEASGKIVDFVDYWPGYATRVNELDAEGNAHSEDGYLIVSHFSKLSNAWTGYPYEVWMQVKDNYTKDDIYRFIEDKRISVLRYQDKIEDISEIYKDPLLQGTNGVLTMGFIVTLILCSIGYLIFWMMSVKERELMFGVLRAGGMHGSELILILFVEQFFCGFLSCIAGAVIGFVASKLFVPILQYAYADAQQTLPMEMIIDRFDMIRLYSVIAIVMAAALIVLISIIRSMNITKALKLGEE